MTPFLPRNKVLQASPLPDLVMTLIQQSARLSGQLAEPTRQTLTSYMRVINSYYSNLIEGNGTQPHEIRAAQRGSFSSNTAKRDWQRESIGQMAVQSWLEEESPTLEQLFSPAFIGEVHRQFYQNIPESFWELKNQQGEVTGKVVPGEWRTQSVKVGQQVAAVAKELPKLMEQFCEAYHPDRFSGERRLIAIMAAHHRLAWIHPFLDGNGRVGRLITDAALKAVGLDSVGVWCLSRGLARRQSDYKAALALADSPRQGDLDGRGQLSEKALIDFCEMMLVTANEQVSYFSELLDLGRLGKRIDGYVQARNDSRVLGMDSIM